MSIGKDLFVAWAKLLDLGYNKKILIGFFVLAGLIFFAQVSFPGSVQAKELKIAYVNVDKVIKQYHDLQEAKNELNRTVVQWEKQRDSLRKVIDSVKQVYENQKVMLSEETKLEMENEIKNREEEYKDFWRSIWGKDGKLEKKTKELVDPLTKKIYDTIKKMAEDEGYDLVLDISSGAVVYASLENDITGTVLDELNKEYLASNEQQTLKPLVAVFPLKEADEASRQRELGIHLQEAITQGVNASPRLKIISPGKVKTELENQGIQKDFLDEVKARQVAQALGAKLFVYGTVHKTGDYAIFQVALYDAKDGKKIADAQGKALDQEVDIQSEGARIGKQLAFQYKPEGS